MRIAAGALRGRRVAAPAGAAARPTAARARAALFDVLAHNPAFADTPVAGATALDACAGSGALGLEALSRGAAFVHFLDLDRRALAVLDGNLAALGVRSRAALHCGDASAPGAAPAAASIAFLDPPWEARLEGAALAALANAGWLAPGAVAVVEHPAAREIAPPAGFRAILRRRHGRAAFLFLRRDFLPSFPPTLC